MTLIAYLGDEGLVENRKPDLSFGIFRRTSVSSSLPATTSFT